MKSGIQAMATVLVALGLFACASVPKNSHHALSSSAQSVLADGVIESRVEPPAPFRVVTPAQGGGMMVGMMFGAIGGAVGARAADARARALGQRLRDQAAIEDPTPELAQRLMAHFEQRLGASEGVSPIQLQVSTSAWTASSRGLAMHAHIRLIDTRTDTRLAEAQCRYLTPEHEKPASLDSVLADDAAFVKVSLEQAVDQCVDYVSRNLVP